MFTFNLRPHRISLHEMQTIAIGDSGVCQSVRQSAGLLRGRTSQKRLNRSTSCLVWGLLGPKKQCIRWGFDAAFAKLLWPLVLFCFG